MSRRSVLWALGACIAVSAAIGGWWWLAKREAEAAERARLEQEAERAREQERQARIRRESERLIPELLEGVYLGMPLQEARRARPSMTPSLSSASTERDGTVLEESFPNGARAVYVFAQGGADPLERVQVLSLLPSIEAIGPHLAAMNAQYGAPTGVWDCPQTGGVPTRRFTWRHGETSVSDIFLIAGDRVSVTLYIAPNDVIERSLRMAACRPVRDPAEIPAFPVAMPEQLNAPRP